MTPLEGLRVADFSNGLAGALASLILADYGAEVIAVEPPGGSVLRSEAAFPFWYRNKKSVVLDLKNDAERASAHRLVETVDVLLTAFRPGVAERLGLAAKEMEGRNPRLVHASISGFGARGPYARLKGYEGIVMAKMGGMAHVAGMAPRPGPAFPAVPYASFGAAHLAVQGILAAFHARSRNGRGQRVETSLVQGLAAFDPWEWFLRILCRRYPDAYTPAPPYSERGVPNSSFAFRLLAALTRDGHWLQFSQTAPHLFRELIDALGLAWMWDDPEWNDAPEFDTEEKRERFWELLLEAARQRTLAEWEEVFHQRPNVWAEPFRTPPQLLDHPQLRHNRQVISVDDPQRGASEQLAPFVSMSASPPKTTTPAPALGEDTDEILAHLDGRRAQPPSPITDHRSPITDPPLSGVTILELGLWYAAPYGSALLADLGARVIKIEPLHGEPMRHIMPVPDAGAIKVLQGKESVAIDLAQPRGRELVHRIARNVDLVLASYRGSVAERLGVDYESLRRLNPRLVYLNAPGYGVDGPCARKPAFAPTIGAAVGAGRLQAGPSLRDGAALSLDEIKKESLRLNWAAQAPGNADGASALGVATALLLGLIGRERGIAGQELRTSMLCTTAYALAADSMGGGLDAGRRVADPLLYGLGPLYRLYQAAEGWIFLACPQEREWASLCRALSAESDLAGDGRFTTAADRDVAAERLANVLAEIFRRKPASEWEEMLTAHDVACVEVAAGPISRAVIDGPVARAADFLVEVEHAAFGRHERLAPLASLSGHQAQPGAAPRLGAHTEAVLREIGCDDATILDLERTGVVHLEPSLLSRQA